MPLNCFAIVLIQRNEQRKEAGLFAEGLELERRRVAEEAERRQAAEEALPGRAQQEEDAEREQAIEAVRRLVVAEQEEGAERRRLAEVRANNVMHV